MNVRPTTVVIMGSSSGVAKAAALLCAERGHDLVLGLRDENELLELTFQCQKKGVKVLSVKTDPSKLEEVDSLAHQAAEAFGGFDVWINDLGEAAYGEFEEVPFHCVHQVFNLSVLGCVYGSRAAVEHFKARKAGVLINIASPIALLGQPYSSYYALSESAVRGLCLSLQAELSPYKSIHVCCLMAGAMDSTFYQHAANFTGRALEPSPSFDSHRFARVVLGLIRAPRPEVLVGIYPWPLLCLRYFFPSLFQKFWLKHTRKHQFQDAPAGSTEGNLFGPSKGKPGLAGGWRRRRF